MTSQVPYIPTDAPFSSEQRDWLNGFLAGLFSATPAPQARSVAAKNVKIFFASQSGVAERLAKKMAKLLKAEGHTASAASVETIKPSDLAATELALFFASTYGEGDPPDSARRFRDELFADAAPRLDNLRYAVFCLGDSNYEHFCRFGIDLDDRLQALGGTRLIARAESDVDVDAPFDAWGKDVTTHLTDDAASSTTDAAAPAVTTVESAANAPTHTRDNPYQAELRARRALTGGDSSKLTMHVSFALEDSSLHYEAGDACGVIAQNNPDLVAEILSLVPFSATEQVTLSKLGSMSIESALLHHLQFTRLTRKMVQAFATKADCRILSALLLAEQTEHLEAFLYGRGLIDLLHEYPGVITNSNDLLEILPRLAPRLYSISSSPAAHSGELHCTIGVVRYHSHNRHRAGIASTMLADRVPVGTRVPLYIQPNKRFRLPSDGNQPVIMIGPGTGIAPFRAFLHERRALGVSGKNWLFFGERSASTDFLYRDELTSLRDSGYLSRLDTAFSRDQEHKVYVQDRMLEHGAELWRWLQDGASLYVCGDASRMAKDVDAALHRVIETHGNLSAETAQEYVSQLQDAHRYHRDVY